MRKRLTISDIHSDGRCFKVNITIFGKITSLDNITLIIEKFGKITSLDNITLIIKMLNMILVLQQSIFKTFNQFSLSSF